MKTKKLLIVVDMQNDFLTGALANPAAVEILPNVREEIKNFINAGHDVVFTRDTHGETYLHSLEGHNLPIPHCIFDTEGWHVESSLTSLVDTPKFVDKLTFGYDFWTHWFRENIETHDSGPFVEEIVLVGTCTDICVVSNALIIKAKFPEIKISVKSSCCAGLTKEKHDAAIEVMKSCQINIL